MSEAPGKRRPDYVGITIALCAVVMTTLVAYRQFNPPAAASPYGRPPTRTDKWEELVSRREARGAARATVSIVEFADFECPACRQYAPVLDSIRMRYPNDVAVLFAHYPLPYHRFAMPAARAAECARVQGRFDAIHDLLYRKQDSLGLKSWVGFAAEAGVPDAKAFAACNSRTDSLSGIQRDVRLAKALGIAGTPGLVVDGWIWSSAPSLSQLDSVVQARLRR